MPSHDLYALLRENSYPGRGIVMGRTPDNRRGVLAYFIMGRSENSRNRIFITEGTGIRTRAFDESKMTDPSLVIYAPVRTLGGRTIVTNGDQTDTIYDCLSRGEGFSDALRTRTFEPDAPNYTPRISALMERDGSYRMSILKSADGDPAACRRFFFEYDAPRAGTGHFIHTYRSDGDPLPSFLGEPRPITTVDDVGAFAGGLWRSLDGDNKVSLFVRYITLDTGKAETLIINKHQES